MARGHPNVTLSQARPAVGRAADDARPARPSDRLSWISPEGGGVVRVDREADELEPSPHRCITNTPQPFGVESVFGPGRPGVGGLEQVWEGVLSVLSERLISIRRDVDRGGILWICRHRSHPLDHRLPGVAGVGRTDTGARVPPQTNPPIANTVSGWSATTRTSGCTAVKSRPTPSKRVQFVPPSSERNGPAESERAPTDA